LGSSRSQRGEQRCGEEQRGHGGGEKGVSEREEARMGAVGTHSISASRGNGEAKSVLKFASVTMSFHVPFWDMQLKIALGAANEIMRIFFYEWRTTHWNDRKG
jgi:hypothetical protein